MIRIIKNLLVNIVWQFLFDSISKVDFKRLFNNISTLFNSMSLRELIRLYWDAVLDRLNENRYYRIIYNQTSNNTRAILDRNNNKFILLSFIFSFIVYRWLRLFKKIILWPFKLGVFSFFYSIFGIDLSWLLGWFDIFYINIPQWVYIQYLTLYNNWLGWWNSTVNIKKLNNVPLPKSSANVKEKFEPESIEMVEPDRLNKKKIIIIVTVIALLGLGIWYFYFYDVNGSGTGGNSPTSSSGSSSHPITINNNQTPASSNRNTSRNLYDNATEWSRPTQINIQDRLDNLRQDRLSDLRQDRLENILTNPDLNPPVEAGSSSPTGSEGSSDTIKPTRWTPSWDHDLDNNNNWD